MHADGVTCTMLRIVDDKGLGDIRLRSACLALRGLAYAPQNRAVMCELGAMEAALRVVVQSPAWSGDAPGGSKTDEVTVEDALYAVRYLASVATEYAAVDEWTVDSKVWVVSREGYPKLSMVTAVGPDGGVVTVKHSGRGGAVTEPVARDSPRVLGSRLAWHPGEYVLLSTVVVTKEMARDSDGEKELPGGTPVVILETVVLEEDQRVRGLISRPRGWISLEDRENGYLWAAPLPRGWVAERAEVHVDPTECVPEDAGGASGGDDGGTADKKGESAAASGGGTTGDGGEVAGGGGNTTGSCGGSDTAAG